MAFPNVIVDCAFDNDINESQYAQTGYSDITRWVKSISGTLRGRVYEMDQVETGSLRIALDNSDGRFTPEDARSPYFPAVTPSRRLRIRGLNLQRGNVAATGSVSHDSRGFSQVSDPDWDVSNAQPIVAVENSGLTSPLRTLLRTATIAVPLDFDGDTPATNTVNGTALSYEWAGTDSYEISHPIGATHHIEAVLPAASAGNYGLVQFTLPVEAGRNMRHSMTSWRISGTEPSATMLFTVEYFDADDVPLSSGSVSWNNPTSATATERYLDSTCPVGTAYARGMFCVIASAAITAPVTYGFEKGMSCYTPNAAANPVTYIDAVAPFTTDHWYVSDDTDPSIDSTNHAVQAVMSGTDASLYTLINGTIPGVDYDVSIDCRQYTDALGTPVSGDLFVSTDGGLTGVTVSGRGLFSTAAFTFTADGPTTALTITMADGTDFASGWLVEAKNVSLYPTGESHAFPVWELPKPIFEGWVEAWPLHAAAYNGEMSVVVNDRLKRLGDVLLSSPWAEQELSRGAALVLPLNDQPEAGKTDLVMQGSWANFSQVISAPITPTHASLAGCSYTLGVLGPAGANSNAMDFVSVGTGYSGYFVPIPFSLDYAPPPPPVLTTQPGQPKATAPTYAWKQYTSTFYSTWSQTYKADDTQFAGGYCYQGYFGSAGNTTSLAGFNGSLIKSTLAGVTLVSCKAVFYAENWVLTTGGTLILGTHTYTGKPGTWDPAHVHAFRFASKHMARNQTLVYDLGLTAGKEFQAWTVGGLAFGPGPTTGQVYAGYFRGAGMTGRPYLSITYNRRVKVS